MANKKGSYVTYFLMLLLILALGGFGVTNFGGSSQTVASVGDAEVTANDYARALQSQINGFQRETGQALTFQQAQMVGLDRAALGQLITEAALENETNRIGLSAGDENVAQEIQSVTAFHNVSGEFDRQTYELALRQSNLSIDDFETQVRGDLGERLLQGAIGAGVETPDIFVDTLYRYARETRDITWARLTADDLFEPVATPTESKLAEYHEANPAPFTRPETKVIRYAWLTPDMLAPNIEVDEDQVRKLYDTRFDEFNSPERRLVERLIFADQTSAQDAWDRLDVGEVSFDELVAERGLELADIDLGDVDERDLGDAAGEVFGLAEPGVVGPLVTDFGPALFRMNGILAAEEVTFDEARADLKSEAATDRARRIILELVPQIEDMLAGGADTSLLAERTDLEAGTIEWDVDASDGIAAYQAFRSAAASTGKGDFAEVIELDDGGIVSLTVDDVLEPALRPLQEVRGEVAEAWMRDATQTALTEQAEALAQQLRDGREMAAMELDLNTNRELLRDGFIEGTPPDFLSTVFDLEANGIAVLSAEGDAWLVRVDAIAEPDGNDAEADALKNRFSAQTTQAFSAAITQAFMQALVEKAGVDINTSAITSVHSLMP